MLKEVQVTQLKPGDVLEQNIYNKNGIPFLQKGTTLTEKYIKRLRELNIRVVFIKETSSDSKRYDRLDPVIQDPKKITDPRTPELVRLKLTRLIESEMPHSHMYNYSMEMQFKRVYRTIVMDITSHSKVMEQLGVLWESDRYLFTHSINVSVYSAMMGTALNYDNSKMLELVIGSLLFDIGMTRLPYYLLKSDRPLTVKERELLDTHTREGYALLKNIDGVGTVSARCALLHHERYDGTGYPFKFRGEDIPEEAQIVAISDVFDALISPRYHRSAYTKYDATEFLYAAGNHYFKAELIQTFLRNIQIYPEKQLVELSNGQVGVVSSKPSGIAHRPIVKIIRDSNGKPIYRPYEINLVQKTNLSIRRTMKDIEEKV